MEQLPSLRLSEKERDAAIERMQAAYLEGRLAEAELGDRIEKALAARVSTELTVLVEDLPEVVRLPRASATREPLREVTTHKGSSVQNGPWVVPDRLKLGSYKSTQVLDLTHATLTSEVTEFVISAYKSTVEVIVPKGLSVEIRGSGYASTWNDETGGGSGDGPLLVLKGNVYKSTIRVRS